MSSQLHQAFELIRTKCITDTVPGSAFERFVKLLTANEAVEAAKHETEIVAGKTSITSDNCNTDPTKMLV